MDDAFQEYVEAVRRWLRERVVGLGLCPYAAGPLAAGRVRLAVAPGDLEARLSALYLEAQRLVGTDAGDCETTLLLVPDAPAGFEDFLDETELGLQLLEDAVGDTLQVVAFHPRFRFEGSLPDDPANGVNQAPVALWHLLRASSIDRVVSADPEGVDTIPVRNRDLLRRLSSFVVEG